MHRTAQSYLLNELIRYCRPKRSFRRLNEMLSGHQVPDDSRGSPFRNERETIRQYLPSACATAQPYMVLFVFLSLLKITYHCTAQIITLLRVWGGIKMFNLLRLITHCNVNRNYREEANRGRGLQRSAAACRRLDLNVCEARLVKMHMILPFFLFVWSNIA